MEAAYGEWTCFKDVDNVSTRNRGRYMEWLMFRLKQLDKLVAKGKLIDPATAVCKWHDHDEDESESCPQCYPKRAMAPDHTDRNWRDF